MSLDEQKPLLEQVCRQMRPFISPLADGSLRGFAGWYARLHVSGCAQCTTVLKALVELRLRLRQLGIERRLSEQAPAPSETPERPELSTEALLNEAKIAWEARSKASTDDPPDTGAANSPHNAS
ncbi:MAG: hypothetical protein SFU56_18360 [Capsulimonadales bacterium]|nr:hypothetical protein [Capsulimonadales bacterium]